MASLNVSFLLLPIGYLFVLHMEYQLKESPQIHCLHLVIFNIERKETKVRSASISGLADDALSTLEHSMHKERLDYDESCASYCYSHIHHCGRDEVSCIPIHLPH